MYKRLVVLAVSLFVTASAWAQKNKLNVFIWSEYIDPKIIENFAKENDCKVTVDLYEDNESMMAKLEGGGDALYDICVPSDYIIPALIKNSLIAPLRRENIPNMKNMDPKFANREYDPGNKYTVPYQWGTVGLFVRKGKDAKIDETWGLLFDPKKSIGSFLMIDDTRACIGAALKYKGYSLNTVDKKQMKEARDLLLDAKKRSLGFEGGVGIKNKVLARVCRVGMAYNGDAVRGMKEDSDTYFFVPREGTEIWLDNMAIPGKTLYVDPKTLPAGPFLAYDHAGRLVSTIYMVPLKDIDEHKKFAGLGAVDATVDHVDLYYNAGHPGVEQPHYHIVLWHVTKADEAAVAK